jgi:hypothetical protein
MTHNEENVCARLKNLPFQVPSLTDAELLDAAKDVPPEKRDENLVEFIFSLTYPYDAVFEVIGEHPDSAMLCRDLVGLVYQAIGQSYPELKPRCEVAFRVFS